MDLKIIKAGHSGTGILIEQDAGYINPLDSRNQTLIREFKPAELHEQTESLIVYVVLQKYNIKNRNGRIYTEAILKQQNEFYQQAIKERRAVGECVPSGTEVFTTNGWKKIENVSIGEEIFTLNLKSEKLEIQAVNNTIRKNYNDELVHLYNKDSLDMKLTKNHKVILWDRYDKVYEMTAIDVYEALKRKDSRVSHSRIKHGGIWEGVDEEYFTLPGTDIQIDSEIWAAFLGIFIAEGHTGGSRGGIKNNRVTITQVKANQSKLIIDLLNKLPFEYSISDNRQFNFYNKDLYNHLTVLGNSWEKYIPNYAKNWSPRLLNILLKWMLIGDGRNRHSTTGELLREYCTTSQKLSEDVYEIMLKLGSGAIISTRIQKDRFIYDTSFIDTEIINEDGTLSLIKEEVKIKRLIKADNSKPLFIISERTTASISFDIRHTNAELIPFNDEVFCVSVPNKTWLMRFNNKSAWTHNCDHPESSVISADRISHNIIQTWWEGHTLMGKMEILMTKGYLTTGVVSTMGDHIANLLRHNIMIGVSSRGVGSLKEINGDFIVQDDFELICWDIVTAPSTPGSWIFKNKEEARPYVESVSIKKDSLNEGLDKFLID